MKPAQLAVGLLVIVLVALFISDAPDTAVRLTHSVWHAVQHTASGLVTFVNRL